MILMLAGVSHAGPETFKVPIIDQATRYGGVIQVALGKAREIRTAQDIVRVAIGSEVIADIMLAPTSNPRLLRIVGRKNGTTNLIVWFADGTHPGSRRGVEYDICVDKGYRVEVITGTVTDENASLKGW